MKLNQVIALVAGKKARASKTITDVHHGWKESELTGISRVYSPINEDGERFPNESKEVQLKVKKVIPKLTDVLKDFYDLVRTQEEANCLAKANIEINGTTILYNVPVTVILFLEKQITDLLTFAKNMPVLSKDKRWNYDANSDTYVSEYEETTKTKKIVKPIIKYEATKEHPAQTEMITVDETVGRWKTTHFSGAVTEDYKEKTIKRLETLQDALKTAREEANSQIVEIVPMGDAILNYVFSE